MSPEARGEPARAQERPALDVTLHGALVGRLTAEPTGLRFEYERTWLGAPDPRPLSCSLPLRAEPFDEAACRPFFANLLPDGGERVALANVLGRSEGNDFALLAEVGGDCGGAVSLQTRGTPPAATPIATGEVVDDTRLAEIFAELDHRPFLAGTGVRMSLAGAQPKLPIVRRAAGWSLPGDGRPSTHILKPEPRRFPGLGEVEHACMELARAVGLEVPATRLLEIGRPVLEVERYDRRPIDGGHARIHQEDFCQALAVMPERKYEVEGGPGVARCVELVRRQSATPAADVLRLLRWIAFNVVVGNCDAHAKNLSLLLEPAPRLAPFYDLVATMTFPGIDRRLAMAVGGERLWDRVGAPQWKRLAKETSVAERRVVQEVTQMCEVVPPALEVVPLESARLRELSASIRKRCAKVAHAASRG